MPRTASPRCVALSSELLLGRCCCEVRYSLAPVLHSTRALCCCAGSVPVQVAQRSAVSAVVAERDKVQTELVVTKAALATAQAELRAAKAQLGTAVLTHATRVAVSASCLRVFFALQARYLLN